MVYAPFGSVPASRLALSWSGRQRHGGEKASKECTTGAPNESRFFFCSSRPAPLLGVRYDRICPSLPFFGSGDVTGDDEHRFRLDPGEAISRYAPGLFRILASGCCKKKKGKLSLGSVSQLSHTRFQSLGDGRPDAACRGRHCDDIGALCHRGMRQKKPADDSARAAVQHQLQQPAR